MIVTRQWVGYKRIGRLQIRFCLMRHRYAPGDERWVFQPSIIYDRFMKKPTKVGT